MNDNRLTAAFQIAYKSRATNCVPFFQPKIISGITFRGRWHISKWTRAKQKKAIVKSEHSEGSSKYVTTTSLSNFVTTWERRGIYTWQSYKWCYMDPMCWIKLEGGLGIPRRGLWGWWMVLKAYNLLYRKPGCDWSGRIMYRSCHFMIFLLHIHNYLQALWSIS